MTSTALKAQIDSQITNETLPNSITPAEVGGNLKSVVDYVDDRGKYKSYRAIITPSAVVTVLSDGIGFGTPTITNPANGKIHITNTGFFSGKIVDPITSGTVNNSGTPYLTVLAPSNAFPDDTLILDVFNLSGTQTSTPTMNYKIEIRVYE